MPGPGGESRQSSTSSRSAVRLSEHVEVAGEHDDILGLGALDREFDGAPELDRRDARVA